MTEAKKQEIARMEREIERLYVAGDFKAACELARECEAIEWEAMQG